MYEYASAKTVDFSEIPVISVANISRPDQLHNCGEAIVKAAGNVWFFYIVDHGISPQLRADAFAAAAEFFSLDADYKASIAVNQHQRGWMAQGLTRLEGSVASDAKEVFFWGREPDDTLLARNLRMVAPNQWPDNVCPAFRANLLPYYEQVMELGTLLLSAIACGLGKPADFFEQYYQHSLGRGQVVCYPPSVIDDAEALRFGAAEHTDFGVLTILSQDHLGGLQVQNRSGEWIEAPPLENSFVCNIGDLLERWTNGQLVSTLHRVINRSSQTRFSIPVFHDPDSDAVVDSAAFAQTGKGEFQPIEAGEYIASKNKKNFLHYNT